jgi:putative radical SAM enzyme (TIGR03279 family)
MPRPHVRAVEPGSPAASAGLTTGDVLVAVNGVEPRDIIEYRQLIDEADPRLEVERGGLLVEVEVAKPAGTPLGAELSEAVFDGVTTCDNHCEFCFIYQLPRGLRRTLYVKDDDYRLSFLYGNFTTLTRFTEADLERVVTERLSPLYVSVHATSPELRASMLRNPRGAVSLRWLIALVEAGIEVHAQVVLVPERNDGVELEGTLVELALLAPGLASIGVVPYGVSRFSREELRATTPAEAAMAIAAIESYDGFASAAGLPRAWAADELYLVAGVEPPALERYGELPQLENGIGMIRTFEAEFEGRRTPMSMAASGFFQAIEGAPAIGYRSVRLRRRRPSSAAGSVAILTSTYGQRVIEPVLVRNGFDGVRVVGVPNEFFGGNVAVAGLLAGQDVARVAASRTEERLLLPDVCLSNGRFIDGVPLAELDARIEVVETNGRALRRALELEPAA